MTALAVGYVAVDEPVASAAAILRHMARSRVLARTVEALPLIGDVIVLVVAFSVVELSLLPMFGALIVVGCVGAAGMYRRRITMGLLDVTPRVLASAALGGLAVVLLEGADYIAVDAVLAAVTAAGTAAIASRSVSYAAVRRARRHRIVRRRTAVLGAGPVGSSLVKGMLDGRQWGLQPVAIFERGPMAGTASPARVPVRTFGENIIRALKTDEIETVIVAFPNVDEAELLELFVTAAGRTARSSWFPGCGRSVRSVRAWTA